MVHNTLGETVKVMKSMADMLVPKTYPRVGFEVEQDVILLKQRTIIVDGYETLVCYSKADYGDYFLESVQVQSTCAPFLPFNVVCKSGRAFLGSRNLCFVEFFKGHRKVYCWTIKSREGRSLPPDKKTKPGSYEGFAFSVLHPGSVDLF